MPSATPTDPRDDLFSPAPHIDAHLRAVVARAGFPPPLRDAVEYALLGGGKRLRPVLLWHACESVGGRGDMCLPAAAALELVHAFSLVHDDLPALDNDDLRRGRPTLHKHAGEALAILAGDAMLALAPRTLSDLDDPARAALAQHVLAAATLEMISGQVLDTFACTAPGEPPERSVERVHAHKTGALLRAACELGAICGLPDPGTTDAQRALDALRAFGSRLGLMFQIVDDLIDATQPAEAAGKKTGKDAAAGKLTYPGIFGLERSRQEVQRLLLAAEDDLRVLGPSGTTLRSLARFLAARQA